MDERRCSLHPIEVRLLSIDLIHFPDQQVWIGVKVGYNLRHGQATAPLKEARPTGPYSCAARKSPADSANIPVFGRRWPETWFDRDWVAVAASCFHFAGKETSFDSCQEAGEPGGSTPLGQKLPVFWTESST